MEAKAFREKNGEEENSSCVSYNLIPLQDRLKFLSQNARDFLPCLK